MVITLTPEIETALSESAKRQGISPETLALTALRERFVVIDEPRDEWERRLRAAASDCGTAISNEALRRENLYD